MEKRNRVFLDSSILITALLSSRGGSFYILNNLKDEFDFQINQYVFNEVLMVLRQKFSSLKGLESNFFLLLGTAKIKISPNSLNSEIKIVQKIVNKKDAPILASAIKQSDYLLTLDKDFLTEKIITFTKRKNLFIVTPREFLILQQVRN